MRRADEAGETGEKKMTMATAVPVPKERLREVIDAFGGPDALREKRRAFQANREYLEEHHEELTQQYPNEWVGIVDQQVKAHATAAPAVVRMLRDADEPLGGAVLHFMTTENRVWLL